MAAMIAVKKTAKKASMKAVKKTAKKASKKATKQHHIVPVETLEETDRRELMEQRFATLSEEGHYMVVMAHGVAAARKGKAMRRVEALLDEALMRI